jgi:NAD(P)-dependent dehydrogenase (short-subunit alcohol dehydrogenase family)
MNMAGRLDGKVAVITGAASGIGRASAELFVAEGARVVAADIATELGRELQEAHPDSIVFHHTDVTDEQSFESAVAAATSNFGRLDIMFNNAGALIDPSSMFDMTASGFDQTMALLGRAAVLGHRFAARQFRAQSSGGSIVTTASVAGLQAGWAPLGYTVGKHAILGVVRQAVAELAPLGIRSNAIAPGIIVTPGMTGSLGIPRGQGGAFLEAIDRTVGPRVHPIGRMGRAEDVAEAALYLASDASSFVTGIVLPVDGGLGAMYMGPFGEAVSEGAQQFLASLPTPD